ncbi:DODA-type extradiol aromatic ring-opening family dioxygenase [Rhodoferax aquaticus]|uniref:Dioxygenase n=1 Tax=Rhodoferax aquaticus TaxID=2527691 RepID=A0A515EM48_9BURK|nr:class III extradiol ring-cleavage dioxygenase [Rhodoferax aquaticus]QDL53714.1 dioxygenase [Rhodoferax aquaticus]
MTRMPTYFISHGGGPWPYMEDMRARMRVLEEALQDMPRQVGTTPSAVLVISGHWEEADFAVMSHAKPPMVYDYSGFPAHTYEVVYPAPGAPALAQRIESLIHAAGLPSHLDPHRGFDHGTFAPLVVMYPDAQVPVLQVALKAGLDPAIHIALGRALAPLRDEGVLIVGSGQSYHNLRMFGPQARQPSNAFDAWLQDTLLHSSPEQREARLVNWAQAPSARMAHPREEHLLPLMVALGAAAGDAATCVYHEEGIFGGVTASSFRFDAAAT